MPIEGPARRARVLHRVGRHQSSVSHQAARAVLLRLPGAAEAIVGGMIADVIAVIGSTDVVMGDVDR